MSKLSNVIITCTNIVLAGLLLTATRSALSPSSYRETAAFAESSLQLPTSPTTPADTDESKQLKLSLSISSPQDLKVRQGDTVIAGQVLADRVEERSRLLAQRQALELSLKQIQSKTVTIPLQPLPVPTVKSLPPISYTEEEAAIQATAMNTRQAERVLQQQQNFKTEPLEESAAVQKAAVELQNQQRLVENQLRMIDAVATLKNLPPEVAAHEQEVLKQKQAELQQAQAEYQQATAKLSTAKSAQTEKLKQLQESLEKARADHQLAIAKLQTKKDQRAYTEYEASITAARRAEEQNQAAQNYSRQLLEAQQQERDRSFQVAQVQAKIAEVDNQLSILSTVTSPYAGRIQRVKVTGQNDRNLSVEVTLVVGSSSSAAALSSSPTSTTASTTITPSVH